MAIANHQPTTLWIQGAPGVGSVEEPFEPVITPFMIDSAVPGGCVIVCPGGGYGHRAPHEGEPIARALNERGIAACVCDYRISPYRHPYPLMDAQRAIRWVRVHADELNVKPNAVAILGFSAGGHLVSTAGTHYDAGPSWQP